MGEWKEYKLGYCVDVINGYAFKSTNFLENRIINAMPVVKIRNVANGDVHLNNVQYHLYDDTLQNFIVQNGDVLITLTGNHPDAKTQVVGEVSIYKLTQKALLNQRVAKIIAKKSLMDPMYMYYLLKDNSSHEYLAIQSSGSANQANISKSDIENMPVIIPNIKEQRKVSFILSSLDDKIDLLDRQNATLEKMAETLFRQWFIEDAKEDWKEGNLGIFLNDTLGGEWGKEFFDIEHSKTVQCIRGTDIADLNIGMANKVPVRFIKESKFEKIEPYNGDLILEISGGTESQSTGRVTYINEDVKLLFDYPIVFSNFCRLLKVKKEYYSYFLYCYLQYLYKQDEFFNLENGSSGIKNLNYKALLFDLKYPIPKQEDKIVNFHNVVKDYFKKINHNKFQIRTLTRLRDTLLPKLMNGEITVK